MKKTIEEVASWYANELIDSKTIESHEKSWVSSMFFAGAKYQSEQMYSYEDLGEAFMACWIANMPEGFECKLSFIEWFNQFKKK